MRANLDATGGLLLRRAHRARARAAGRAGARPRRPPSEAAQARRRRARRRSGFRDALLAQPAVAAHLDAAALDALLDPAGYLGATPVLVERALARAERELP